MAGTLGRNLHLCFTKIKRPLAPESITADHQSRPIFIKNYNSLYDYSNFNSAAVANDSSLPRCSSSSSAASSSSSDGASDEPDLADVFASQRFFFSSPGRSNSITESAPSIATSSKSSDMSIGVNDTVVPQVNISESSIMNQSSDYTSCETISLQSTNSPAVKDSVAVHTYSPDPYLDFRRSMQEMVEARNLVDVKANLNYLHELLLYYLALNPKSAHKFIVSAFADLLVSLLSSSPENVGSRRENDCETVRHCI